MQKYTEALTLCPSWSGTDACRAWRYNRMHVPMLTLIFWCSPFSEQGHVPEEEGGLEPGAAGC